MPQITSNALAYAAFRSAGGFRRAIYVTIAYAALVLGVVFMALALNPRGHNGVFEGTARFLLGVQAFILGAYTCFCVMNTIQRDTTSRMLESHRLMPVDPRLGVLGYMAGAVSPVILVVFFNFIVGGMSAGISGLPLDWWVAANIVLFTFAIFCLSLAAGGAFYGNLLGLGALVPVVIVFISGGVAGQFGPPLLMLTSPMLGPSIFSARPIDSESVTLWTLAVVLQASVAIIAVNVGARRFRYADANAFTPLLGIVLVAVLAVAGAIVVNHNPAATFTTRRPFDEPTMATGTLILLLIVGAVAIASCAAGDQPSRRQPQRSTDWRYVFMVGAMTLCAGGFAAAVPGLRDLPLRVLWSATEIAVSLTTAMLWARFMYRKGWGSAGLFVVLLLLALAPVMVAVLAIDYHRGDLSPLGQAISQVSPFAMFPAIWSPNWQAEPQVPSLIAQILLLAIPSALLWRGRNGVLNPLLKAGV